MANSSAEVILASRYGRALFESSSDELSSGNLEVLTSLVNLWNESEQLRSLSQSPTFSFEEKLKVYEALLKKLKPSKNLSDFVKLLIERDRIALLPEILEAYRARVLLSAKKKVAKVETAFEFSKAQEKKIAEILTAALDQQVDLEVELREDLLAGFVIHVDGKRLDATLVSNLETLKTELLLAEA